MTNSQSIIVKVQEFKERDLLVHVISEQYKKLSFVFKGANSMKSRRSSLLQVGNIVDIEFNYVAGKTIFSGSDISLIKSNTKLIANIEVLTAMSVIYELAYHLSDEYNCYLELAFVIENINQSNAYIFISLFYVLTMEHLGIMPYVDGCVICDNPKIINISIDDGGFICHKCNKKRLEYDKQQLLNFRIINKIKIFEFEKALEYLNLNIDDILLLNNFMQFHSSIQIKSLELLKEISH